MQFDSVHRNAHSATLNFEPHASPPSTATGGRLLPNHWNLAPRVLPSLAELSVKSQFEAKFQALAHDPEAFHALMADAFGNYDRDAAEALRQRALAGDFAWLPDVEFVSGATLQGANGAYDAAGGRILLNRDLLADGSLLAATYMEEVGHHIDILVNDEDTIGDEGEIFRLRLLGQALSANELALIRAENDHGVIMVDGQQVAVEFFLGSLWRGAKKVGKAFVDGAVHVAEKAGTAIVDATVSMGNTLFAAGGHLLSGAWAMTYGAISHWVQFDFEGGWRELREGARRAMQGVHHLAELPSTVLDSSIELLFSVVPEGRFRDSLEEFRARFVDSNRQLMLAPITAAGGLGEAAVDFGEGMVKFFYHLGRGEIAEAGKTFGTMGLMVPAFVDAGAVLLVAAIGALQSITYQQDVSRGLTDEEIASMRKVFGDSIDYSLIRVVEDKAGVFDANTLAFTIGNTIYLKGDPDALISELTHVWQHQNGGIDYITESLIGRASRNAYDWEPAVPHTPWRELKAEQQDAFLSAAYHDGAFDREPPAFSHSPIDGVSVDELNRYLTETLVEIRAGRGAPAVINR